MPAAIGFSDHSGWAVAAVVRRAGEGPFVLVSRARITICPQRLPRQPFHAVAERGYSQDVITEVYGEAHELASQAIVEVRRDTPIDAAGVSIGRLGRLEQSLGIPQLLASHALLHSAEGELYRDALSDAAAQAGLRVVRYFHKEVRSEAAAALGWPLAELESWLAATGKAVGSPWTKDEKDATAAAVLALAVTS